MKNIPGTIYLQIGEPYDIQDVRCFNELEATWSADKINENDLVYKLERRPVPFEASQIAERYEGVQRRALSYSNEYIFKPWEIRVYDMTIECASIETPSYRYDFPTPETFEQFELFIRLATGVELKRRAECE